MQTLTLREYRNYYSCKINFNKIKFILFHIYFDNISDSYFKRTSSRK